MVVSEWRNITELSYFPVILTLFTTYFYVFLLLHINPEPNYEYKGRSTVEPDRISR